MSACAWVSGRGVFARRPSPDDPWLATGAGYEDGVPSRIVRTVQAAPWAR